MATKGFRRTTPTVKNSKALTKPAKLPSPTKTPAVKFTAPKMSNPKQPKPNVSKGLLGYLAGSKYDATNTANFQ